MAEAASPKWGESAVQRALDLHLKAINRRFAAVGLTPIDGGGIRDDEFEKFRSALDEEGFARSLLEGEEAVALFEEAHELAGPLMVMYLVDEARFGLLTSEPADYRRVIDEFRAMGPEERAARLSEQPRTIRR